MTILQENYNIDDDLIFKIIIQILNHFLKVHSDYLGLDHTDLITDPSEHPDHNHKSFNYRSYI